MLNISHTILPPDTVDFNTFFTELKVHAAEMKVQNQQEEIKKPRELQKHLGFFKVDYSLGGSNKTLKNLCK